MLRLELKKSTKEIIIQLICYLNVILFVYAATSKLIDIETFQVQLGQSPLLSAFAGWVSWAVIISELLIALLLIFDKTKFIGLYLAYIIMVMFTTYIVIILNFSSFIPCSCGGILEKLGWSEHLIFNIGFIILSLIALKLMKDNNTFSIKTKSFILTIVISFLTSIMIVTILYLFSEEKIHRNNSFIRRYPPHPVSTIKGQNIKYNSYYIAGIANGRIYLGNKSAPAHLISMDTTLSDLKTHNIKLNNEKNIKFISPQIKIYYPYFFLIDGTIPIIFKGNISDWNTEPYWQGNDNQILISQIEILSPSQFVFRGVDKINFQNLIGRIDIEHVESFITNNLILPTVKDGIFETDGMLRYNSDLREIIYTYYYKNMYIKIDNNLNLINSGKTIDTVKNAVLKIATTNSGQVSKLSEKPLIVNYQSNTSNKYLLIKSDRLGKYEPEIMLKDASIIDVYNLKNSNYEFSFYLYHYKNEPIKSFQIYNNILIGLTDKHIVIYRLHKQYFKID